MAKTTKKKKNLYWFDPIKKQIQKKIEIKIKIKKIKNKQINNISKVQSKLN